MVFISIPPTIQQNQLFVQTENFPGVSTFLSSQGHHRFFDYHFLGSLLTGNATVLITLVHRLSLSMAKVQRNTGLFCHCVETPYIILSLQCNITRINSIGGDTVRWVETLLNVM